MNLCTVRVRELGTWPGSMMSFSASGPASPATTCRVNGSKVPALAPKRLDRLQHRSVPTHRFVELADAHTEVFGEQLLPQRIDLAPDVTTSRMFRVRLDGQIALAVEPHRPVVEVR